MNEEQKKKNPKKTGRQEYQECDLECRIVMSDSEREGGGDSEIST